MYSSEGCVPDIPSSVWARPARQPMKAESDHRFTEIFAALNCLIGLSDVKEQVKRLIYYIHVQDTRKAFSLRAPDCLYNFALVGNPGTGKSTVARILATALTKIFPFTFSRIVSVNPSNLLGDVVGRTAEKTRSVLDKCLNGVLIIDEAHAIATEGVRAYGEDCLAVINDFLSVYKDRISVILCGYPCEMRKLLDLSPGLSSRIHRTIYFPDYSILELEEIFNLLCTQYSILVDGECIDAFKCSILKRIHMKNFGNARTVDNIFRETLENQAVRICTSADFSEHSLRTIIAADIPVGRDANVDN